MTFSLVLFQSSCNFDVFVFMWTGNSHEMKRKIRLGHSTTKSLSLMEKVFLSVFVFHHSGASSHAMRSLNFKRARKHKRRRQMMTRWKFLFFSFFLLLIFRFLSPRRVMRKRLANAHALYAARKVMNILLSLKAHFFPPREKSPLRVAHRRVISRHSQFIAFSERHRIEALYRVTRLNISTSFRFQASVRLTVLISD